MRSFALLLAFAILPNLADAAGVKPPRIRAVAPDGNGVAFWSAAGDWFLVQSRDFDWLLKYSRDGRRLGRISLAAAHKKVPFDLSEPSSPHALLSPDGKQLAFPAGHGVWLLDVHSGAVTPLRRDLGQSCIGLVWLPDGKELIVSSLDGSGLPRHERVTAATGDGQPLQCQAPARITSTYLDETHLLALVGPQLFAASLDCAQLRPLVPYSPTMQGLKPLAVALSPKKIGLAVLFERAAPPATGTAAPLSTEGRVSLWVYSRDEKEWTSVARDAFVPPSFAWLDDDSFIYETRPAADAVDGGTLQRFQFSTLKSTPLLLSAPRCGDTAPAAPRNGGVVSFQRSCADKKKSAVELVSP